GNGSVLQERRAFRTVFARAEKLGVPAERSHSPQAYRRGRRRLAAALVVASAGRHEVARIDLPRSRRAAREPRLVRVRALGALQHPCVRLRAPRRRARLHERPQRFRSHALRRPDAAGVPWRAPLLLLAARARSRARSSKGSLDVGASGTRRAARDRHESPRRHVRARLTMLTRRDLFASGLAAAAWAGASRVLAQATDPTDLTLAEASRKIRAPLISPGVLSASHTSAIVLFET